MPKAKDELTLHELKSLTPQERKARLKAWDAAHPVQITRNDKLFMMVFFTIAAILFLLGATIGRANPKEYGVLWIVWMYPLAIGLLPITFPSRLRRNLDEIE